MTLLAVSPALAPGKAAPYVIAAYILFLAVVLVYVAIMAIRLSRTERGLRELRREVSEREAAAEAGGDSAQDVERVA